MHYDKERAEEYRAIIEELNDKVGVAQHNESKRLAIIKEVTKKDVGYTMQTVSRA